MPRANGRWLIVYGVLALAVFVGLLVYIGRPFAVRLGLANPPPAAESAGGPQAAPLGPRLDARQRQTAVATPPVNDLPPGVQRLPDDTTITSLARTAADDYRRRARYPRWSQPLEEGEDPLVRDRRVSPVIAAGENGAEPTLTVFPDQISFEAPEPVILYAYLSTGGQRVPAAEIRGTVLTETLKPIAEIEYRDDGRESDAVPGDFVYTAFFLLDPNAAAAPTASYLVKVRALTVDQQERLAAGSFLYSSPDAELTGNYRDRVDGGDLVIDAEIDASDSGRFHVEATLYSGDGSRPIAWAQQAAELGPGRHWLPLRFQGLIIRERDVDGPYLLRFVALSTTTQMPNAKNRLVENAFVTQPYKATAFSDQPFNDEDLLDAADRIERAVDGLAPDAEG